MQSFAVQTCDLTNSATAVHAKDRTSQLRLSLPKAQNCRQVKASAELKENRKKKLKVMHCSSYDAVWSRYVLVTCHIMTQPHGFSTCLCSVAAVQIFTQDAATVIR